MPKVIFTENLKRHVECPSIDVPGTSVHEVLQTVFISNPKLRGYIFDDQGCPRQHILFAVNGELVQEQEIYNDDLSNNAEVYIIQALSGG